MTKFETDSKRIRDNCSKVLEAIPDQNKLRNFKMEFWDMNELSIKGGVHLPFHQNIIV